MKIDNGLKKLLESNNVTVTAVKDGQADFSITVNKKDMQPEIITTTQPITLQGLIDKFGENVVIKCAVDQDNTTKANYHRSNVMVSEEEKAEKQAKALKRADNLLSQLSPEQLKELLANKGL